MKGSRPLKQSSKSWNQVALALKGHLKYSYARIAFSLKYALYLGLKLLYVLKQSTKDRSYGLSYLSSFLNLLLPVEPAPPLSIIKPKLKPWPNIVIDSLEQLGKSFFWLLNKALRPILATVSSWKIALYVSFAFGATLSIPYVGAVSTGYLLGFLSVLCVLSGYFEFQKAKMEEAFEKDIKELKELYRVLNERFSLNHRDHIPSPSQQKTFTPTRMGANQAEVINDEDGVPDVREESTASSSSERRLTI